MDLRGALGGVRAAWSADHVCRVAPAFFAECGWALEVAGGWIEVPPGAELVVFSAAVIVSDHRAFGDHVEAIVYLGVERSPPNLFPVLWGAPALPERRGPDDHGGSVLAGRVVGR
ncbi:hypothetical protein [Frigoriglobus tundricola]|uniref:Uncharacterized protein n=1 Tax=Frigoriglobus tundricola TaxID=2774151 RepID=A0A6M5Z1P8_9BACT|nr:hypothetical protein [Frigoriglobus tundricola]QJX00079.1 hypothetical protein FTUN_7703 [Frigoriglobus tundricola]